MNYCSLVLLLTLHLLSIDSYKLDLQLNDQWRIYKETFNKTYRDPFHEIERREIWEDNLKYIQKHNFEYDLGLHSFTLGANEFTDLSHEEFKSIYLMKEFSPPRTENIYLPPLNSEALPKSVNWEKKGYVTPVKNQMPNCGSCWAFSTTGSLEGQFFRKYNRLVSLSEQQLVDCDTFNNGCHGGWVQDAVRFITNSGGIESEDDYPYIAKDSSCKFNKSNIAARTTGYTSIEKNEIALAEALANVGPISITIDASHRSFQSYKKGIYNEPQCTQKVDHAVLLVGYGEETSKYWIVKNSWGRKWGKDGYIWMSKDKNNQCSIASYAGFPKVL